MTTKAQERQILIERQNGLSPITGKPIAGKRLETDHIKRRADGGANSKQNEQALPIGEHIAKHMYRAIDISLPLRVRNQEMDTAYQRYLGQLSRDEKEEFADTMKVLTGSRVKLY
jgi:hypothetical protein